MEGTPTLISLVTVRNEKLEVNDNALVGLLSQPDVQGRPLAIISIAGAFRTGKSFILNFFIRYLRAKGWSDPNWFGNPSTEISSGFPMKRGSIACTKGIHVWSEVFHVPLPNGEEAAVLLADTQGLYDGDTSPDSNARIMSISTLFSSHQILNVMAQVEERDLEHLQLCVEFAKKAGSLRRYGTSQPFQALTFLIRDWDRDYEHPFGNSTENYLQFFLKSRSQSREVEEVRSSISKAFSDVGCYLLPYPGKKVTRHDGIGLRNKEMETDFQEYAKTFVESVLHPKCIVIKKSADGSVATVDDLQDMIGTVGKAYKSGQVPSAQTLLMSVVQASNTKATREGVLLYKERMSKICEEILTDEHLEKHNVAAIAAAKQQFYAVATLGDDDAKAEFIAQLEKECAQVMESSAKRNEWKKEELALTLKKVVDKCVSSYTAALSQVQVQEPDANFESVHEQVANKVRNTLNEESGFARTVIPKKVADLERKLGREIQDAYAILKATREREKEILQRQLRDECDSYMHRIYREFQRKANQYGGEYEANIIQILNGLKKDYLRKYDEEMSANTEKQHVRNNRTNLENDLEQVAKQAELANENIRRAKEAQLQGELFNSKSEYKDAMEELGSNVSDGVFQSKHQKCKEDALKKFDCQGKGSPDVMKLRKRLENEIEGIYKNLVKERRNAALMEKHQKESASQNSMNRILRQFSDFVDEYGDSYNEDLQGALERKKTACLQQYDAEMANNTQSCVLDNRETLQIELSKISARGTTTNKNKKDIANGEYQKTAREFADAFESSLGTMLSKSYVDPTCLDASLQKFLNGQVCPSQKYKAMPEWGQRIVKNTIDERLNTIKRRNHSNQNFRATKVDDSNVVVKFFKWVGNGLLGVVKGVFGKLFG